MNPKQFLLIGGIILVLVGILGMVGVLGPSASQSVFGNSWWFDNGENWAHLIIGVIALIAVYTLGASMQKQLTMIVGVIGVLVALYGWFVAGNLWGASLENPADNLLHL